MVVTVWNHFYVFFYIKKNVLHKNIVGVSDRETKPRALPAPGHAPGL